MTFLLNRAATVPMSVVSPTGKVVRALPPIEGQAGLNALAWDGKAQTGAGIGRGVYLVVLRAMDEEGEETQMARSVVVR